MPSLVQAACPGCKKVLRIPAGWLQQPIRCKFCGLVMAAKQPFVPNPATPAPRRKKHKKYKTPKQTPVSIQAASKLSSPGPAAKRDGDPFAGIERPDSGPVSYRRRRNPLVSLLQTLLIIIFLGGTAAGVVYLGWKPITTFLKRFEKAPPESVAQVEDKKADEGTDPSKDNPSPGPDTTPKTTPPSTEPARKDPPRSEPPKTTPPKTEPPKTEPPKTEPPRTTPPKTEPPKTEPVVKKPNPPPAGTIFPRRALIISVNNYIFANPIQFGVPDGAGRKGENIGNLHYALSNGLNVPPSQIYLLSDRNKEDPHPPLKATIEQTLTTFLFNSRAQDRIMVFFIGHAVEIEGKAYLAPLEADLQKPDSMIELEWVLKRLAACKARQKILVLDGNRFSPTQGNQRPGAGPVSEKFDAIIKNPPAGVQIWSSCVMNQQSYETDRSPMGIFMDVLRFNLMKAQAGDDQQPNDAIEVEKLNEQIIAGMKEELTALKLEQTPRVSGTASGEGARFDPKEEQPPKPICILPVNEGGGTANLEEIKVVFNELSTPSVKGRRMAEDNTRYDLLPAFAQERMAEYKPDEKESELRKQIQKARAALWAVSPTSVDNIPKELAADVAKLRGGELKYDLTVLRDGVAALPNENQFKSGIEMQQKEIAPILRVLMEIHEDLMDAGKKLRESESKRWQANYDFTLARLKMQIAYLIEYDSLLGQMRKDVPPRDPKIHSGWVPASSLTLSGNTLGKREAANAQKLLDKIAADNAGTPWELLAKRERSTALGLEWKPTTQPIRQGPQRRPR